MELSIIIVNWNSVEFLRKCIASIEAQTLLVDYEIVVIDSASFDGCDRMLRDHHPQVTFIQSLRNVGFGRANNKAFEASRGQVLLFLNPDTEIVGPAIDTMYAALQALPDAGAVGCRLLNSDRTIQTSCIQSWPNIANQVLDSEWLRSRWPRSALWGTAALYEDGSRPRVVDAIAGACLMVKREVFQRVGLFGSDYFMYAEDIDLCYNIVRTGCTNYYIPEATVIHYGGGSSEKAISDFSAVMMRESIWRFLKKSRGRAYGHLYRVAMLLSAIGRLAILRLRQGSPRVRQGRLTSDNPGSKWRAVLRWSVDRERVVKQYDQSHC